MTRPAKRASAALLSLTAALALAGCDSGVEEEETYEAGVEAVGPGELIVSEPTPGAVPVDVPDAAMTPVAPGDMETAAPAETPPAE